jgi:hypothetical protein
MAQSASLPAVCRWDLVKRVGRQDVLDGLARRAYTGIVDDDKLRACYLESLRWTAFRRRQVSHIINPD